MLLSCANWLEAQTHGRQRRQQDSHHLDQPRNRVTGSATLLHAKRGASLARLAGRHSTNCLGGDCVRLLYRGSNCGQSAIAEGATSRQRHANAVKAPAQQLLNCRAGLRTGMSNRGVKRHLARKEKSSRISPDRIDYRPHRPCIGGWGLTGAAKADPPTFEDFIQISVETYSDKF